MKQSSLRIAGPPLSRREFLGGAVGALGALALGGCASKARILNFYNWSIFIGPDTLAQFKKATGIEVNYEEFSSADVLYAKIKIGVTGYDLIVAPDYLVHRMERQKLLHRLPRQLDPRVLLPRLRGLPWDPGLEFSFPYLWGTTGIAYQKDKVPEPPDSWNLLWDPRLKGRITILDEKRDAIGAALIHLGLPGNSIEPEDLRRAKESLLEQKQLVRRYSSDLVADLIRRETWAALAWSGDAHQAMGSNPQLGFFVPREGSFFYVDNLCIPRTARHLGEAMEFIEFYTQPEVAAGITNGTGYPNAIEASLPLVKAELRNDPLTYPTPQILERLVFQKDLGQGERSWDLLWEEVKR